MTPYDRPRTRGVASALAVVVMALAFVACSEDKKAPTTTAPPGFEVMSNAKEGFALAVPADWTSIPLTERVNDFNKTANDLRLKNPKLASILNQARLLGQSGGKFMAVNAEGTSSVNLTVDKPKEKTLDEIVRNSVAGLTNVQATNIKQEASTLDGKPAMKLTFRLPVETDEGVVQTDEVQHYLLDDKKAYILSVLATPPEVADTVASSLRLR